MVERLEKLKINIHYGLTSYYHQPESSVKNERQHRILNDLLSEQVGNNVNKRDPFLNSVLGALRMDLNESTLFSPYYSL